MNFFKNALVYRLNRNLPFVAAEMQEQMEQFRFTPTGAQDMAKSGWVSPLVDGSDNLVHEVNGQLLLKIRKEEKILPAAVLRKAVTEKVAKLEEEQSRKLKKTEKDSIKDEVLHTLLPRAFTRDSFTQIWIDTKSGLITVDAPSAKKAEDGLALLRKSLGSLPVTPVTISNPIELTLTDWLKSGELPEGFTLGDSATLKAALEDGGVLKSKKQDLVSDEIRNHLDAGKLVTELALGWQDRITFTLTDAAAIKRIHFSDELAQQNSDIDVEDKAQRADADFLLMTGELSAMISQLVVALGGEQQRG